MHTRFFRSVLLSVLLLLPSAAILAGGISGRVTDDAGKPVIFASVLLLGSSDSALVKTELTNEKGEYHLTPVDDGTYLLKVNIIGYIAYTSAQVVLAANDITMPDIMLLQKNTELKEVAVRAQKPFIEVHADKLVVNVESSIVNAGSTAMDVLSRSPGVTVDNNDRISLKGRQGITVMINGKIQPISGQDLANMLKSMPSNNVESIELISNPSARYDAAGTGGIINIKLKRDKKMGLNGSVNATYAQGVYGKANAGLNMNYRNKKVNLFANYNHSDREGFNHLTLDRNFYDNGVFAGAYDQNNHYLYDIVTDMGGLGMDYNLSSKTTVGFALSGEATSFLRTGYNYSVITDSATQLPLSHFVTDNKSPNRWSNGTANINLRHTFDSSGKTLSVDADYATYPGSGNQEFTTTYFTDFPDGTSVPSGVPAVKLNGDLKGHTQIRSLKADYAMPLPNGVKMEAGAKTSLVTSDHDLLFFNELNGMSIPDSQRTNHFIYKEHINAAYLNFNKDWDKWSTQLGLRTEQTIASGDATWPTGDSSFTRNYAQLFPSFAVQRHINPANDLGVTLSRRIERPNYEQLNPSTYYLDPTTYKTGDPYLMPALSYAAELSYTYKQKFITNLNYTRTFMPITEVIQPSLTERKVTIQTQKNLTSMSYYGINGSYQFRFYKWWSNTTNVNVYYAQYTGNIAGTGLNNGRATFDANTSNSFILPANWSAELSGFYQAPQLYGYMLVKPTWMLNLGIQKNLFDKRATARINATDIFWRGYPRATSTYTDYRESFIAKRDTRQVAISFTYRFGKRTLPPSMRHRGGAEDEKRRAGSQAG
ncbi:MAG: TonB-dependent receptor [Taibaiella sp.]|nr:TonB-dependent receptor [Taibaiella sp.]